MAVLDFFTVVQDMLMLLLYGINVIFNAFFNMQVFYGISIGHILLAIIAFGIILNIFLSFIRKGVE